MASAEEGKEGSGGDRREPSEDEVLFAKKNGDDE